MINLHGLEQVYWNGWKLSTPTQEHFRVIYIGHLPFINLYLCLNT